MDIRNQNIVLRVYGKWPKFSNAEIREVIEGINTLDLVIYTREESTKYEGNSVVSLITLSFSIFEDTVFETWENDIKKIKIVKNHTTITFLSGAKSEFDFKDVQVKSITHVSVLK